MKNNLLKNLKQKKLRIFKIQSLYKKIIFFGKTKVFDDYANSLYDYDLERYIFGANTNQLAKLIDFDNDLGICILNSLLNFEKYFSNILVKSVLATHKLNENYILEPNPCNEIFYKKIDLSSRLWKEINDEFENSYLKQSFASLDKTPFRFLVLSWSFGTLINFFRFLNKDIQNNILIELRLKEYNPKDLIEIIHLLRILRNLISHNQRIYTTRLGINPKLIESIGLFNDNEIGIYPLLLILENIQQNIINPKKTLFKLLFKYRFNPWIIKHILNSIQYISVKK